MHLPLANKPIEWALKALQYYNINSTITSSSTNGRNLAFVRVLFLSSRDDVYYLNLFLAGIRPPFGAYPFEQKE